MTMPAEKKALTLTDYLCVRVKALIGGKIHIKAIDIKYDSWRETALNQCTSRDRFEAGLRDIMSQNDLTRFMEITINRTKGLVSIVFPPDQRSVLAYWSDGFGKTPFSNVVIKEIL